jgi:hypothetical protein
MSYTETGIRVNSSCKLPLEGDMDLSQDNVVNELSIYLKVFLSV